MSFLATEIEEDENVYVISYDYLNKHLYCDLIQVYKISECHTINLGGPENSVTFVMFTLSFLLSF